jgi:phosphoribosylaminoimidazole carboxylase (NCAIR synthetase)
MNREKPLGVGIIGGGQLGRMMALEAPRLRLSVRVLDAGGVNSPAGPFADKGAVEGGLKDADKLKKLAEGCDVVTMEIEHVSVEALEMVSGKGGALRHCFFFRE